MPISSRKKRSASSSSYAVIGPHCGSMPRPSAKPATSAAIDGFEVGKGVAENLAHGDDALRRGIESAPGERSRRNVEAREHVGGIEVDQQGALKEDACSLGEAAGAADLAAVDLDVVARPVARRDAERLQAQLLQPRRYSGSARQGREPQRRPIEDQFPAELAFVEVEGAAAGDAGARLDAMRVAIVELDLATRPDGCRSAREGRKRRKRIVSGILY